LYLFLSDLRGVSADVLWLEEFAHIKKELIDIIVVPLMQLQDSRVWAISSPLGETNHATKIANIVDPRTNKRLFFVLRAAWCDDCCRSLTATHCVHTKKRLPTQFSSKTSRAAKLMLGDDNAISKQELEGESVGDGDYFFDGVLKNLIHKEGVTLSNVDLVFIFVDPAPGTSSSDFALVSVVRKPNPFEMVIVGYESISSNGSGDGFWKGQDNIIIHIEKLLLNAAFMQSKFVVIIESVHHVDASRLYSENVLQYFRTKGLDHRIYIEKNMPHPDAYGVLKTERDTWGMAKVTYDYLETNKISFLYKPISSEVDKQRDMMLAQLSTFHTIAKTKPDGTVLVNIRSDGKDDLAICLQSVLYHENRIRKYKEDFKDWANSTTVYKQVAYQPPPKRQRLD